VTAAAARCQQRIAEHSERIAQTDAEADGVRAETKALAAQWRDSLAQLRAADAAMQVCALCLVLSFLPEQHVCLVAGILATAARALNQGLYGFCHTKVQASCSKRCAGNMSCHIRSEGCFALSGGRGAFGQAPGRSTGNACGAGRREAGHGCGGCGGGADAGDEEVGCRHREAAD
jgi:hypothetical protein